MYSISHYLFNRQYEAGAKGLIPIFATSCSETEVLQKAVRRRQKQAGEEVFWQKVSGDCCKSGKPDCSPGK